MSYESNPRRRITLFETVGLIIIAGVLVVLAACGSSPTGATSATPTATPPPTPSPTPTPVPTCAAILPGAGTINLAAAGFAYLYAFPNGTVGTTPAITDSGTGLFTVRQFTACTPGSSISGVQSFFSTQLPALPHGWFTSTTFPDDGGLMKSCAALCFFNPKGGPFYSFAFDQFSDHGSGVITYRVRWAVSPSFPACASSFYGTPGLVDVFFVPQFTPPVPVPPVSSLQPDDASGGVRGFEVCSPGTVASVTAFMTKELPATGWTKVASNPDCIFTAECWTQGSSAVSWNASGGATSCIIAWRVPLP
jgi:hypothetical protein